MKIKDEHYATLKALIVSSLEPMGDPKAVMRHHVDIYEAAERTKRTMRFDLFWHTNRVKREEMKPLMSEFYRYANDDHLETALKAIIKEILEEGI